MENVVENVVCKNLVEGLKKLGDFKGLTKYERNELEKAIKHIEKNDSIDGIEFDLFYLLTVDLVEALRVIRLSNFQYIAIADVSSKVVRYVLDKEVERKFE